MLCVLFNLEHCSVIVVPQHGGVCFSRLEVFLQGNPLLGLTNL